MTNSIERLVHESGRVGEFRELSLRVTARSGSWNCDVIRVPSALVMGVEGFLTFDKNAAQFASPAGLPTA